MTPRGALSDRILMENLMMSGFIAMFPAGIIALAVSSLWWPLVYVFWAIWPVLTYWFLVKAPIRVNRCTQCMTHAKWGATRCRKCGQNL